MKKLKPKKYIACYLVIAMIITMFPTNRVMGATTGNWEDYTGSITDFTGAGTEGDPYQISSPEELAFLAQRVNAGDSNYNAKWYKLTQDIDLVAHQWTPIGIDGSNTFKGNFDGQDHQISNVIMDTEDGYVGFFGFVGQGGIITNIGVNVNIKTSNQNVGGLVGYLYKATIINSYATGSVESTLPSSSNVGGLVGFVDGGSGACTISNSYATGSVTGYYAGGLVGWNYNCIINNSYATGSVTGSQPAAKIGALVGMYTGASGKRGGITNGYFNSEILSNGLGQVTGGSGTPTPKTTAEMQSQAFVDNLNANRVGHDDWHMGSRIQ